MSDTFNIVFVSMMGLICGSFFNVCIVRIPNGLSVIFKPSHCPKCSTAIRWYQNIPVLSYLFLRGRCAKCKKRISIQYPLVEIASALIFGVLFWKYGMSLQWLSYTTLVSMLLIISVIDLYHQIIPDELSLSGIVLGFVFALVTGDVAWWESLLGIVLGGGSFLAIALVYEKLANREGLGGGDVKLNAMLGAWLGYQSLMVIILVSTALGSLIGILYMLIKGKDFKAAIPFGPFLAIGAVIYLAFGDRLLLLLFPVMR